MMCAAVIGIFMYLCAVRLAFFCLASKTGGSDVCQERGWARKCAGVCFAVRL